MILDRFAVRYLCRVHAYAALSTRFPEKRGTISIFSVGSFLGLEGNFGSRYAAVRPGKNSSTAAQTDGNTGHSSGIMRRNAASPQWKNDTPSSLARQAMALQMFVRWSKNAGTKVMNLPDTSRQKNNTAGRNDAGWLYIIVRIFIVKVITIHAIERSSSSQSAAETRRHVTTSPVVRKREPLAADFTYRRFVCEMSATVRRLARGS